MTKVDRADRIVVASVIFVALVVAAFAVAYGQAGPVPEHIDGSDCEWDLETFEVICPATPTPKPKPKATATNTPKPKPKATATNTPKPKPKATATNTPTPKPKPKATATNTPRPRLSAPPAPRNLRITSRGTNKISLSWSSRSGVRSYRVRYGSITRTTSGTSYTATGLSSNRSYTFRVAAYGNGTTYRATYGSDATASGSTTRRPTATPTPTPKPKPGWSAVLTAKPSTIVVKQGYSLVTADVSPPDLDTRWVVGAPLSRSLAGCQADGIVGEDSPRATQIKVWGCKAGTGTVTLETHGGTNLGSVTVTVKAKPLPLPPAPNNLRVTSKGTNSIGLSWDSRAGIQSYRVRYGSTTRAASGASDTVPGLSINTSYTFRVAAYGDGKTYRAAWGADATVSAKTASKALSAPPAPGNLRVTSKGTKTISLAWDSKAGVKEYRVRYGSITRTTTGASFTAASLSSNTSYTFMVSAYGDGTTHKAAWGADSTVSAKTNRPVTATATPKPKPKAQSAPTIHTHESVNPGEIRLKWAPVSGVDGYYVEQRKPKFAFLSSWPKLPSSDFPGVTVTITETDSEVTAVIDGLEPGKSFKHRVRSYKGQKESDHSNEVETKALALPKPTGLRSETGLRSKDKTRYLYPCTGRVGLEEDCTDSVGRRVLVLDWDDVSGTGITYEVQLKDSDRGGWETLTPASPRSGIFSITFSGSWAEVRYPVDGRKYEYKLRSVKGSWKSDWSAKRIAQMPDAIPHLGHQQDHTVKYKIGVMPSGSASLVSKAISTAVTAWDSAVGRAWPNLTICDSCGGKNTDGHTVTINVVSGETSPGEGSTRGQVFSPTLLLGADCGARVACVKPAGPGDLRLYYDFWLDGGKDAPWRHMKNLEMVIEDPPWGYGDKTGHTGYVWTNDAKQHGHPVRGSTFPKKTYRYLPAVVMHEFGHTLGLEDLYKDKYQGRYPKSDYLMSGDGGQTAILPKDIDYVKQVYRNGHGTEPH